MKHLGSLLVLSFIFFLAQSFVVLPETDINKYEGSAQKIELPGFKNLYKINDSLYRSEQPSKNGMQQLQQLGIKTVLNFRNHHNDKDEAAHTNLIIERISLNTNKICYSDVVQTLKRMQQAKKPILLHCLHGSDRTGCMIAAYRLVYNNYTKEQAIAELRASEFGYHQKWFPNVIQLLNDLDVQQLKKDVGVREFLENSKN